MLVSSPEGRRGAVREPERFARGLATPACSFGDRVGGALPRPSSGCSICCSIPQARSGLGIRDWGLGIGDWKALFLIPNPQSAIPNSCAERALALEDRRAHMQVRPTHAAAPALHGDDAGAAGAAL